VLGRNGGSPAHFWAEWSGNPHAKATSSNTAQTLGAAAHHLFLGQADFRKHFAVRPSMWDSWRTKDAQEWRARTEDAGISVLTQDQVEVIMGMEKTLSQHKFVREGLLNGLTERSMFYQDRATGLWVKSRPDVIPTHSGDFVDIKTTRDIHFPASFAYHQQAALVREAALQCIGLKYTDFMFTILWIENEAPYCVRVQVLDTPDVDLGAQQNRFALDTISGCLNRQEWPGPYDDDASYVNIGDQYRERARADLRRADQEHAA